MSKPVLVSGGDGFIGKNVVKRLLNENFKVLVVDNNISSFPENIDHINFTRKIDDISKINIDEIPEVSGIIHLASVASPLVYKEDSSLVIDPNTLGTRKLIELAQRDKARILFASTSEVYGHFPPNLIPDYGLKESSNAYITPLSSRSCYSNAKRFGEELILQYKNNGGDAANFRLFNVYGKGMDLKHVGYGRVIPNFINKMNNDDPVVIFGDGVQVRSFIWIDDAVEAILKLFFHSEKLPVVVNIGNDEPISILDLAHKVASLLQKDLNIQFSERDDDDPLWRRPNIELIKQLLDWQPQISLDEGLKLMSKEKIYL